MRAAQWDREKFPWVPVINRADVKAQGAPPFYQALDKGAPIQILPGALSSHLEKERSVVGANLPLSCQPVFNSFVKNCRTLTFNVQKDLVLMTQCEYTAASCPLGHVPAPTAPWGTQKWTWMGHRSSGSSCGWPCPHSTPHSYTND